MICTARGMNSCITLVLCFGFTLTLIDAFPDYHQTLTKTFANDGSLESFFNAINYGSVRAVQQMVATRDVNAANDQGVTGLHVAAIKGNEQMAELLIESGANVNLKTINGTTALHIAANNGNEKFAKALINAGAEVNCADRNGVIPLQLAVFENYRKMSDLLIKSGSDVNHQDDEGKTVLHWAAAKASAVVTELLINSGAKSVSIPDNVGKTPLYYGTMTGNSEFVDVVKNFLVSSSEESTNCSLYLLLSIALYSIFI